MATRARTSALRRLSDAVGIIPKYLDQTGTEWRETTTESRVALLAAMGIQASTASEADRALRALRAAERRELVAPVRVIARSDDTATRHVPVRLASAPNGAARWTI